MKLLFDENLAAKLVDTLIDIYPGSVHVRDAGLASADDNQVWDYAYKHGLVIVSKDSDFQQRSFVLGHPPKVIWVRLGNCTTNDIARLLRERQEEIAAFEEDKFAAFLSLS